MFTDLYRQSNAREFGLSSDEFAQCLDRAGTVLYWQDWALAQACARGSEQAWTYFFNRYPHRLQRSVLTITHDEEAARELAHAVCVDLFTNGAAKANSKLGSYQGLARLERWLRSLAARSWIEQQRRARRLLSLDAQPRLLEEHAHPEIEALPVANRHLEGSVRNAIGRLASEERQLVYSFFFEERTMAELARTLAVHESTVSRRLAQAVRRLRRGVKGGLREQGLSERAIKELFASDTRVLQADVARFLRFSLVALLSFGAFLSYQLLAPSGPARRTDFIGSWKPVASNARGTGQIAVQTRLGVRWIHVQSVDRDRFVTMKTGSYLGDTDPDRADSKSSRDKQHRHFL